MRHRKRGRKLGRTQSHRVALGRNLVSSLFKHERIVTTISKAKEYKSMAEKLITMAKRGTLHDRRRAVSILQDQAMVKKLFDDIAPRYKDRPGGYTRILKLQYTSDHRRSGLADAPRLRIRRLGDAAPTVYLELVGETMEESQKRNDKRYRGKGKKKSGKKKVAAVAKTAVEEPAASVAEEDVVATAPETVAETVDTTQAPAETEDTTVAEPQTEAEPKSDDVEKSDD